MISSFSFTKIGPYTMAAFIELLKKMNKQNHLHNFSCVSTHMLGKKIPEISTELPAFSFVTKTTIQHKIPKEEVELISFSPLSPLAQLISFLTTENIHKNRQHSAICLHSAQQIRQCSALNAFGAK